MTQLLSIFGLKRPDVPFEALFTAPAVDTFCRRVEFGIADGGFVMVTGDPGTGKSVALRLLAQRLRAQRDRKRFIGRARTACAVPSCSADPRGGATSKRARGKLLRHPLI